MVEKKVIAVIVEGPSDESAIGGILKEYFCSEEVQFAVVHGDITSDYRTTVVNVVEKVNKLINELSIKYGYKNKDFVGIIHIADTDGTFADDFIVEREGTDFQYYENRIKNSDAEAVKKRNKHKSEIMLKLYTTGKINGIRYRLYFNSCNLEHVLYNELKPFSDDEKEIMSDEFAEKYEGKAAEFIKYISKPDVAVKGTYKETWKFIQKDNNSLCRNSNMHLIFNNK